MEEIKLKYGCNPNQNPARVYVENGKLPIKVLNGSVGYINLLDALNGWQLVKELKEATCLPAATSFKHVSPAGAAVGVPLNDTLKKIYFVDDLELTALASAYARARGADRMSSFGDFIALSDNVDVITAKIINREVSDGVIAPSYDKEALEILKKKRKGNYTVIQIDKDFVPEEIERKDVFGITFEQKRNNCVINERMLEEIVSKNRYLPNEAKRDLLISLITLKYTQSNSVCYAKDGQAIGIGAGQQSRIHCTRLAGNKADLWYLRQHPAMLNLKFKDNAGLPEKNNIVDQLLQPDAEEYFKQESNWNTILDEKPHVLTKEEQKYWISTLEDVSLGSDAFFPFSDNIKRAAQSGVKYIAEPGGSIRDDLIVEACDKYNMVLVLTKQRLFHH